MSNLQPAKLTELELQKQFFDRELPPSHLIAGEPTWMRTHLASDSE